MTLYQTNLEVKKFVNVVKIGTKTSDNMTAYMVQNMKGEPLRAAAQIIAGAYES